MHSSLDACSWIFLSSRSVKVSSCMHLTSRPSYYPFNPSCDLGIITTFLREEALNGVDISEIARRTKHFSGSDLKHLCVAAALASIQEIHATMPPHTNVSENDNHGGTNLEPPNLPPRVLTPHHFASAFRQVSASCSEDLSSVKRLRRWAGTFASNSGAGLGMFILFNGLH